MKLFSKIKKTPRKVLVALFSLLLLVGIPAVVSLVRAEFYPNRTPFDYSKPCNPNDGDIYDRCGSLTGPVFNSFINTPSYGDERAFVDARRSDQTAAGSFKNVLPSVTEGSKEIVVRMYVHNNANQSTNASGLGVAKNTKVRVDLPSAEGQSLRARGYISADNATPGLVEDTVDFVDSKKFKVEYVPGSATLYNNQAFSNGTQLSDSIVTTGAPIGDNALDGNLPGCFEYEAVIQVKLKVVVPEEPKIDFKKQVRKKGDSEWKEVVNVKPGEKVEWLLTTKVVSGGVQNNVTVRDRGVPNNTLESGSVKWIDASQGTVVQGDRPLFDGGINFGNYTTNGGFYVMFTTTANGDFKECEARVRNFGYVKTTQTPMEIEDYADVIITKENCKPDVEQPEYSCDLLKVTKLSNLQYRYAVEFTAKNGAVLKSYTYNFGDNSQPLLTTQNPVEHTYAQPGDYAAKVTLTFTVDGQDKVVDSNACATIIKTEKPENCPIPGKEHLPKNSPECVENPPCEEVAGKVCEGKTIPDTGAGSMLGIFAATTAAGTIAYRLILARRFQ